jgi:hypothetical protein
MTKRRRRRSSTKLLSQRTITEINAKRRAFIRDVSAILTEALGFPVRVSLVKPDRLAGLSPDQRRFARLSKKDARANMRAAFAPFSEGEPQ